MDIRPIKCEADHQAALSQIERLLEASPGTADGDLLEVLATLVAAYEDERQPIPAPDPVAALEYWMESRGLARRDLEPYIGSRARVAEVLNRRRALTLEMIRRLHDGLGIPAEILIGRYDLETAAA